jgi:uncharacterized membrane protein
MILFHLCYDLNYFRFISDIVGGAGWIAFRSLIVSLFLFAVGVSLVLVHRRGIRRRTVLRRALILGAAAGGVSLATRWIFPDYWVYFGILHLIWVASLLGLLFIGRPLFALAAAILILWGSARGWLGTEALFQWLEGPLHLPEYTVDLAPLFPWFSVVLLGISFASFGLESWPERFVVFREGRAASLLALAGRHSLLIYLVHQPIIFGIVWMLYRMAG